MSTIEIRKGHPEVLVNKRETEQFDTGTVLTLATGHFTNDIYQGFLTPLLPLLIKNMSLAKADAGLLTVFQQWPSLLQPVIGHFGDRFNLKWFFILAPATTALIMSMIGIAPTYAILAMLMVCGGLSSASLHAVGPVIAGKMSGKKLGLGMSIWMVGGELGRALGPIFITSYVAFIGLKGTPWLVGFGFLASLLMYFNLKNIKVTKSISTESVHWVITLKKMRRVMLLLMGILIFSGFLFTSISTYLPIFLTEQGADLVFAGASLSIMEAAGVVGIFLGGPLSDRIGRRHMLFIALVFAPILLLLFVSAKGLLQIAILLGLGFTGLATTPVMMALVQEQFPDNRSFANGVYMALNFVIRPGVGVFVGLMGDHIGLQQTYIISAILAFFALPLVLLLPVDTKYKNILSGKVQKP